MKSKFFYRTTALVLSAALSVPVAFSSVATAFAADSTGISYEFSGNASSKAGYAEGTITFRAASSGSYKLYWADDTKALDGYYPIGEFSLKSGEKGIVKLGYHTVIPAKATKIIATTSSKNVSDAAFVYDIPANKQLSSTSGELLYTFSTYSDLHIDERERPLYWVNAQSNLSKALNISAERGADIVVISGDCVTCSSLDAEWKTYQSTLSQSDYCNPVWESDGNHDLKAGVSSGLSKFVNATGTDGSKSSKSYFSMTEEKTGDLFIFMSLETSKDPNKEDIFSSEQISWAKGLIEDNYTKRNIFLVEHAPVKGFGAGDRMSSPYYGGLMDTSYSNNAKFKQMLKDYPDIVFLSGHTHIDLELEYNYSDENGTAANMIHTPALAGSTKPKSDDSGLDYNDGKGYNSQGYFVEVYENEIVFNGLNVTDDRIYPKYSYIMEGARTSASSVNEPAAERPLKNNTVDITGQLSIVKAVLSDNYKFASYDSYQALKKLYYKYKGQAQADESVIDEFQEKLNALAAYTGGSTYYPYHDAYYFVNNNSWSSVYAYAWDGSSKNAEWPGVKLDKTGVDSSNKDIYKIQFEIKGQYPNIIFNNGSNEKQTVDIALAKYQYNGFSIGSTSDGKYNVNNFAIDGGTNPENPPIVVPETDKTIALLYYVTDEHDWTNIDTYLQPDGTGLYKLTYTPKSENNFSCSLYNKTDGKYYCLTASEKFTFEAGQTFDVTLEKHSSRGKSITVYGMSPTNVLDIVYDPSTYQISITCRDASIPVLENISQVSSENVQVGDSVTVSGSAQGGKAPYTYAFYYKKSGDTSWNTIGTEFAAAENASFTPDTAGVYDVKAVVKDSMSQTAEKLFTVTATAKTVDELKNTSVINSNIVQIGDKVRVSASANGGTAPYTYAYYYKRSTNTSWKTLGTEFGTTSSVSFAPTAEASFDVKVIVKDSKGNKAEKLFTVEAVSCLELTNVSVLQRTNIKKGTAIPMIGKAVGGSAPYTYSFYFKRSTNTNWKLLGDKFGAGTTARLKPTASGSYDIRIDVKDSTGTIVKKFFTATVK